MIVLLQSAMVADSVNALASDSPSISLLDILMQGGILMIPLLIMSMLVVFVIVERWMVLSRSKIGVDMFLQHIKTMLTARDREGAMNYCEQVNKPLGRILKQGIRKLGRPISDIENAIQIAGKKEIFALEKRMNWLATIAGVAPLVGFLGTVTGMIDAFMEIQNLQGNANPSALAGGIWEALITTAVGLLIGIVAYGFYNFLLSKINRMVHELENASAEFIDLLQSPGKSASKGA